MLTSELQFIHFVGMAITNGQSAAVGKAMISKGERNSHNGPVLYSRGYKETVDIYIRMGECILLSERRKMQKMHTEKIGLGVVSVYEYGWLPHKEIRVGDCHKNLG